MASNKSQLDVYKIDTHTVINDILSNLTDIENEQFKEQIKECAKSKDVLSDAVLSCIHRIIDHIMKMHNDKKNTLHYIKKRSE